MKYRQSISPAAIAAVILFSLGTRPAQAWIYPEHRQIAGAAVTQLTPEERATFDRLWTEARTGHEARLCDTPWAGDQGPKPACIDWAAFPAISGDHSCSPNELLATVLESKWILPVASICSVLEKDIATAQNPVQLRNRLVKSDLKLERTDPEYSTRAGASNVHFLLARTGTDPLEYARQSLAAGAEPNGIGVWVGMHMAALRLAADLAEGGVPEADRPARARAILATEAFALHFLEDAFASGHVAGCWGNVATRKGTHDYYNEQGLSTHTWGGEDIVLKGDARMRKEDLERGAPAIRASISQLLAAMTPGTEFHAAVAALPLERAGNAEGFNVCQAKAMPELPEISQALKEPIADVLRRIPVAGFTEGIGSLPRYRSEVGPFLGLASSFRGAFSDGALDAESSSSRVFGSLDIGVRAGLGLDALLGDMGDGQIFVQVGVTYVAKQKSTCREGCGTPESFKALFPQMPARSGISTRLRMPFWLLPYDLLWTAPVLLIVSPKTLEHMAIQAANGGVIPWQAGIDTGLGRLQFCLGREVGATFFGYSGGEDQFLVLSEKGNLVPVSLRSIELEFPFAELRPMRDFSATQRATLLIQLGFGMDIPTKVTALYPPGAAAPALKTTYLGYLKLAFDWRRYLGN